MASQSGCLDQLFGRSTYYTTSDGQRHKAEIFVAEYKRDPPASMKDVSMASQSGCLDQLFGRSTYYTTSDGQRHKAEIFVALMPYSNLPFGLATHN